MPIGKLKVEGAGATVVGTAEAVKEAHEIHSAEHRKALRRLSEVANLEELPVVGHGSISDVEASRISPEKE